MKISLSYKIKHIPEGLYIFDLVFTGRRKEIDNIQFQLPGGKTKYWYNEINDVLSTIVLSQDDHFRFYISNPENNRKKLVKIDLFRNAPRPDPDQFLPHHKELDFSKILEDLGL